MQLCKTDFTIFLNTQLNEQQYAAVTHPSGPLLVIAGAGSGKTRIITARIAYLILQKQIDPTSIVGLTFTNKAAQEMRERITAFIGSKYQQPFLGTFHAYCLRLLREYGSLIDIAPFSILDEADQETLIKKILAPSGLKHLSVKQAVYQLSTLKNSLPTESSILSNVNYFMRDLYRRYEAEKKSSKCLDFDDLLLYTIKLFGNSDFKQIFRNRIRHILVDEYQDTNIVQHILLKHMAVEQQNCVIDSLCVVGDEDQAIYSWRGATIDNIIKFRSEIANTTFITIEQNYRSAKPILDAANKVIKHNSSRHKKNLWSTKKGHNCIMQLICASDYQEAESVALAIRIARQKQPAPSIAVLYRTHFQSRVLEEALIRHSITYRIIRGIQFYERKEIKDLLAYLRLIANPFDRVAFTRAINCPARNLGEKFLELFYTYWQQQPFYTYQEIAHKMEQNKVLKPQQHKNLTAFLNIFDHLTDQTSTKEALTIIIKRTNYFKYLRDTYDPQEAHEREQNIKELINAAQYFASKSLESISLFLQEVALLQEHITGKETEVPVQLMTLHAAKGLEFDTVIITGLEEGLFPSSRSLEKQSNIEEERRLLYVGITRSKNNLLLLLAENRCIFGNLNYQTPSRFLQELPDKIIKESGDNYNAYSFQKLLQDFFQISAVQFTAKNTSYQKEV